MNTKIICLFLFSILFPLGLFGCSSDQYDRRPGWFDKPKDVRKVGSIHLASYSAKRFRQRKYTIIKINGEEIKLNGGFVRSASICRTCEETKSEAVAFEVFSANENLRGYWVLQITNGRKKFYHLCSSISRPMWNGTATSASKCNVKFNTATGKCIPSNACTSSGSLVN